MNSIPKVRDEVEVQVLDFIFKFHRLKWTDASQVNQLVTPLLHESLAQMVVALRCVSGKVVTPDESLKILIKLPKQVQQSIYKLFITGLDPHRFFSCQELTSAPDATIYARRIAEEEEETDKVNEEVEDYLVNKFGRKEVDEEMALGRQIIENTGYAGAIRLENKEMDKANYEEQYLADARERITDE